MIKNFWASEVHPGKKYAVGYNQIEFVLYNMVDRVCVQELNRCKVKFSPDGGKVAMVYGDRVEIRRFVGGRVGGDVERVYKREEDEDKRQACLRMKWSMDSRVLVMWHDTYVVMWEIYSNSARVQSQPFDIDFHPNGRTAVVSSGSQQYENVDIWNVTGGCDEWDVIREMDLTAGMVKWSPDGKKILGVEEDDNEEKTNVVWVYDSEAYDRPVSVRTKVDEKGQVRIKLRVRNPGEVTYFDDLDNPRSIAWDSTSAKIVSKGWDKIMVLDIKNDEIKSINADNDMDEDEIHWSIPSSKRIIAELFVSALESGWESE